MPTFLDNIQIHLFMRQRMVVQILFILTQQGLVTGQPMCQTTNRWLRNAIGRVGDGHGRC
jgi:hypothetical protein